MNELLHHYLGARIMNQYPNRENIHSVDVSPSSDKKTVTIVLTYSENKTKTVTLNRVDLRSLPGVVDGVLLIQDIPHTDDREEVETRIRYEIGQDIILDNCVIEKINDKLISIRPNDRSITVYNSITLKQKERG